ncbi:MAG TPA: stage II sporulation protein R, partial [Syntrophomonas wolfei]|nr:stage II sporulation protein R [Syntrophomonas wolfei]
MPRKYLGIIMIAILILLGSSLCLQEKPLNKSVLRLHVIANSDSLADQALKIQVKDAVVEMMKKEFAGMDNMEQARQAALEDIAEIKRTAE